MEIFYFILLLLALVCFAVAAARHRSDRPLAVDLIALGLALWVAVPFLKALQALS
jgi:hypothetical protein